jgi:hypothetical protein
LLTSVEWTGFVVVPFEILISNLTFVSWRDLAFLYRVCAILLLWIGCVSVKKESIGSRRHLSVFPNFPVFVEFANISLRPVCHFSEPVADFCPSLSIMRVYIARLWGAATA